MMLLRAHLMFDDIAPTLGPSHFENLAPPLSLVFSPVDSRFQCGIAASPHRLSYSRSTSGIGIGRIVARFHSRRSTIGKSWFYPTVPHTRAGKSPAT